MRRLLRKYYLAELTAPELEVLTTYICNQDNTGRIYHNLKPLWDEQMQNAAVNVEPNLLLLARIKKAIISAKHTKAKKTRRIYNRSLGLAVILLVALCIKLLTTELKTIKTHYPHTEHLQKRSAPPGVICF